MPAPRTNQGVIHDIGYRHYDGPRLGRAHIARALLLESAKGAYGLGRSARSKVMPMLLLAAICLPAFIIAVVAAVTDVDELPADYTSYVLNVQALVMIYVAAQSPALVSRDLRFRVMSLYFSRPLHRIDYVVAKYAAMTTAVFLLMALPLTIMFVGALLAELPIDEQVPDYLRSLGGALLTALVLSGIGLVIAAITPRRGLGVAAIIAVLAVLAGVQGAMQAIAVEENEATVSGYAGLISPFTMVDGVMAGPFGAETIMAHGPVDAVASTVFCVVVVLLVAVCYAGLLARFRKAVG